MVNFYLLARLFDETQYNIFVEEVVNKYFTWFDAYDQDKYLWMRNDSDDENQVPYHTARFTTPLQFSKMEPLCESDLKYEIVKELYQERIKVVDEIERIAFKNESAGEKLIRLCVNKLNKFINDFPKTKWLSQKEYLLEELTKIRIEVRDMGNNFQLQDSTKLIWYAGPTILATMFYELNTMSSEKGTKYLQASSKEIEAFILSNFLDEKSQPLSPHTIKKYLKPKQLKAKGHDKVDIPKITADKLSQGK